MDINNNDDKFMTATAMASNILFYLDGFIHLTHSHIHPNYIELHMK